jgi:hypothetical protein
MTDGDDQPQWRQGHILSKEAVSELRQQGFLPLDGFDDAWIVAISHSCDLASSDFDAEPHAELIPGRPIEARAIDGNCAWGKNPRLLHVPVDEDVALEFWAHQRLLVPRRELLRTVPDRERLLPPDQTEVLVRWVAKRYWRSAFPDEFNLRISEVANKVRGTLKKRGGVAMASIWVMLNSEDELPAEQDYEVAVRGVMTVDDHENEEARTAVSDALEAVVRRMTACPGVLVRTWDVVPESDMSLDDVRYYKRWDYDDLSHREPGAASTPEA